MTIEPVAVMNDLYEWLGVAPHNLNPQNLTVRPHEADSYYRFKYRHVTYDKIAPPQRHPISSRIDGELKDSYPWFYELFYPGLLDRTLESNK